MHAFKSIKDCIPPIDGEHFKGIEWYVNLTGLLNQDNKVKATADLGDGMTGMFLHAFCGLILQDYLHWGYTNSSSYDYFLCILQCMNFYSHGPQLGKNTLQLRKHPFMQKPTWESSAVYIQWKYNTRNIDVGLPRDKIKIWMGYTYKIAL